MDPNLIGFPPIDTGIAPSNIPDLIWYVSTALIVFLMGIIASLMGVILYFVRQWANSMNEKMDVVVDTLNGTQVSQGKFETRLEDHIGDDGKHCKGLACPNSVRG